MTIIESRRRGRKVSNPRQVVFIGGPKDGHTAVVHEGDTYAFLAPRTRVIPNPNFPPTISNPKPGAMFIKEDFVLAAVYKRTDRYILHRQVYKWKGYKEEKGK